MKKSPIPTNDGWVCLLICTSTWTLVLHPACLPRLSQIHCQTGCAGSAAFLCFCQCSSNSKRVHYLILRCFIFNPPAHSPASLVPSAYAGRFLLTGTKLLAQSITQIKPYQSGDSTRKQTNSNVIIQIMMLSDLCTPASFLPVQFGCFYIAQAVWVGAGEQQDVGLGKEHNRRKSSHPSGAALNQYSWPSCWMNGSNLRFK